MTASRLTMAGSAANVRAGAAKRGGGPVIVLTYAYAGAPELHALLGAHPGLACTSGTGLLPLCEQAALTWSRAEGRGGAPGSPSALAAASIRALTGSIAASLLAREGKARWCEIATAPVAYAETFLRVYPDTQFICLHRNCADVIRVAVRANPWGIPDEQFGLFAAAYPGRSAAALAAYWRAQAGPMLDFEATHPRACRRVRYEDLTRDPGAAAGEVFGFLGLDDDRPASPGAMIDEGLPDGVSKPVPVEQLPPPLLSQVNALLARLSYPPLA